MSNKDTQVAVLFATVCDSERLYETLGDDRAHRRIAECAEAMASAIAAEGGRVVKTADAEILAVLRDADSAFRATSRILDRQDSGMLPIRIGFHIGPVIVDAGDVYGDTVNLAARVMALARAGEALVTDAAVQAMSGANRKSTRLLDRETSVKGKSLPITVHEIVRVDQDMTMLGAFTAAPQRRVARLGLVHRGRRLTIDGPTGKITIGRVDDNDLVVPDAAVSRLHATIEARHGHFHISDISTNGTYVQAEGQAPLLLKREGLQLTGSGAISLGRAPDGNDDNLIRFEQLSA